MRKIMLIGLLSLFGCSAEDTPTYVYNYTNGKPLTEFQGFKWEESSQVIYDQLGEPLEVDPNGLIFTYGPDEIRVQFRGNKVKETKFYFRVPFETEADGFDYLITEENCTLLPCRLSVGEYWFADSSKEDAEELLMGLNDAYYPVEPSIDDKDKFLSGWGTRNRAVIFLEWGNNFGVTYLKLEYHSPMDVEERMGEPYNELEL